jgi:hypothetical protein
MQELQRMRKVICSVVFLLLFSSAHAQNATVVKNVFATPGPNLFYVSPSLAVNEKSRSTQVVWERHPGNHPDHATLARKISPKGVIKGETRTLVEGTNTYGPTILYNKHKNEFAVVYADEFQNPTHTIFIQRLNAKGQIQGAPVKISTDTGSAFVNQHASATFDSVNKRYVIVWSRASTTQGTFAGEGLTIALLNENFVTIAGPALLREERAGLLLNAVVCDLAVLPSGRILVAFTEPTDAGLQRRHYYIAAVEPDLSGIKIKKVTKTAARTDFVDADFAFLPSGTFLYFVDTNRIRKRKIDETGKPVGVISAAFGSPLKSRPLFMPRFVTTPQSTTTTQGLLIAVEDARQQSGNGKIWIQRVNAAGRPAGDPETIDSGFIIASRLQIVQLPSSTEKQGTFSVIYVNGAQITIPPHGEFSELIHLKLTVPF